MLNVIAEAKEFGKAEVDEVAEKQRTDAELKWCLMVAMLLLLLMLLWLWS